MTAEVLAERFGVTVRTIYRDLDSLRNAELPVRAERGRGGGYALDRAYTLPPVNFTPREAAVLVALGRWARTTRLLPFVGTLEARAGQGAGRADRLGAARAGGADGGDPVRGRAGAPGAPPGCARPSSRPGSSGSPCASATRAPATLISTRTVRVVSVVMERSLTLLNCDDLDKGERRQFRLDRILEAVVAPLS